MPVFKSSLDTATYEPHPPNNEVSHYMRKSGGGAAGRVFRAGFVIAEPEDGIMADGGGDDTVFVLEGHAVVKTGEGETLDLRPGDYVSFPKGLTQEWRIVERFKAVFVYVE